MNSYFAEQVFSASYLCHKYVLEMLSQLINKKAIKDLNTSLFFKIMGKFPIEFFSNETQYDDVEAKKHAIMLAENLGSVFVENGTIENYLKDIFETKALVNQIPKYGSEVELIVKGIGKLLLGLGLRYKTNHYQWFMQIFKPIWNTFD